jgi:DNA polymerase-3 subunit alpha (Gram-positive type)
LPDDYVVIDLEMTGLRVKHDVILEVGAARIRGGQTTGTFSALLNTKRPLSENITAITGITEEMMAQGGDPEEVMAEYFTFLGEDILVGHNVIYDYSFLKQWAVNHGDTFERNAIDTLKVARRFLPAEQKKDLASLCAYFSIERENAHRALDDVLATAQILRCLQEQYEESAPDAFAPQPLQYKVKKTDPGDAAPDPVSETVCRDLSVRVAGLSGFPHAE